MSLNFWIKNFYRAHGSAASWEWLQMIAPCVQVLRDLARNFKMMLGSDIGTAHHAMDLSVDIPDLMSSLDEHEVYCYKKGRKLDLDDLPAPDIVSTGFNGLVSGKTSPLKDYNTAFENLQSRRLLVPLEGGEKSDPRPALSLQTYSQMPPSKFPSFARPESFIPSMEDRDGEVANVCDGEDTVGNDNSDDEGSTEALPEHMEAYQDDFLEPTLALETAGDVSLDMDVEDLEGISQTLFDELDAEDERGVEYSDLEPESGDEGLI